LPSVDQFESVFKSASKAPFHYEPRSFSRILVITDADAAHGQIIGERVRRFLGTVDGRAEWLIAPAADSETVEALLALVERQRPELLVTYRNLHSAAWQWPHSLGRHLDVLTQTVHCPVMVIPHPNDQAVFAASMSHARVVMAATDHLAGDGRLVNCAVSFTEPGGKLVLVHIEDDATFERYMEVISKIPSIDTDNARKTILAQLLKEPHDYVRACREELARKGVDVSVEEVVSTGHRLSEYKELIDRHAVELLVMHTRDEDQLAMHGLAYPLAVELRHIPLLLV
jgi:nucleotide-binding universal stress UspA family protein